MSSLAAAADTTEETTATITATTITNKPPANKINIVHSPLTLYKYVHVLILHTIQSDIVYYTFFDLIVQQNN